MVIVIKMKGLPWEATGREIREFFQGLELEDIRLAPNKEGKASGIGFVCFSNDEDARKAMKRNGKYIGKRYQELFLSSHSEMEKLLTEGVPTGPRRERPESGGNDGNRDRGNYKMVSEGFHEQNEYRGRDRRGNSPPRRFDRGRGNPANEREFVNLDDRGIKRGFEREGNDFNDGRRNRPNTNRPNFRQRSPPHNERNDTRVDRRDRGAPSRGYRSRSPLPRERERVQQRENRARREPMEDVDVRNATCVHVLGIPFDARERDLQDFFGGLNVRDILIVKNHQGNHAGKPKGEAYVEFESVGDCVHAAERHMRYMGKRYVEVRRVNSEVMQQALNLNEEINQRKSTQRRGSHRESRGSANPRHGDYMSNSVSAAIMDSISQRYGGVNEALANFMSGSASVAASANINISDVATGRVVGLRNLPSSVSVDEILDFFYGFDAIPDSVRIHYITPGRSSGDAMVSFSNNAEARRAMDQLNLKPVGKRKIELFLV